MQANALGCATTPAHSEFKGNITLVIISRDISAIYMHNDTRWSPVIVVPSKPARTSQALSHCFVSLSLHSSLGYSYMCTLASVMETETAWSVVTTHLLLKNVHFNT